MRLRHCTLDQLITLLQGRGIDATAYSGRAMYGVYCLGIDVDDMGELMTITAAMILAVDSQEIDALARDMRWDNMGKGYILYWPSLQLTPEQIAALNKNDEEGGS